MTNKKVKEKAWEFFHKELNFDLTGGEMIGIDQMLDIVIRESKLNARK